MSTWTDIKDNPRLRQTYDRRAQLIRIIREFFWSAGFTETDTPVAVKLPGQEPYLNPVPAIFHNPAGGEFKFYLQTSPEFAMKKLLAAGYEKIFQICKCFRDFEQFGGNHNTEFTMIEWYRAPGTLREIMDDTENLFKFVSKKIGIGKITGETGGKKYEIDLTGQWHRLSMREIWKKYLDVELNDVLTVGNLSALAQRRGYAVTEGEPYEDMFFKIFLSEIEPKLGLDKPVIVYDYPEQMTSLSRLSAGDRRYAERFELYIGGLELANAFGELTEPEEQKRRLEADREKRAEMKKETWPVDPDFIAALESGIPAAGLSRQSHKGAEAGGIALGIDRMIMLFTGAKDINDVIFQSVGDMVDNDE